MYNLHAERKVEPNWLQSW